MAQFRVLAAYSYPHSGDHDEGSLIKSAIGSSTNGIPEASCSLVGAVWWLLCWRDEVSLRRRLAASWRRTPPLWFSHVGAVAG